MNHFLLMTILSLNTVTLCAGDAKPADAKALGKELMNNLPGIFSLDQAQGDKINGRDVPAIRNGDWILTTHPISLIESFAANTNTVATLFVKSGDEFIRISTTEENQKVGTILDHASPAYHRMIGELRYTNKVTLSGKDYMADYDVFRDRQGRVLGAYLVAIPL